MEESTTPQPPSYIIDYNSEKYRRIREMAKILFQDLWIFPILGTLAILALAITITCICTADRGAKSRRRKKGVQLLKFRYHPSPPAMRTQRRTALPRPRSAPTLGHTPTRPAPPIPVAPCLARERISIQARPLPPIPRKDPIMASRSRENTRLISPYAQACLVKPRPRSDPSHLLRPQNPPPPPPSFSTYQ